MLEVTIPEQEFWNEATQEFINTKPQSLQLEHSLVSLSKWESKWRKPFLGDTKKTNEEVVDYIRCMNMTQNVKPEAFNTIPNNVIDMINEYIKAPMTATWFNEERGPGGAPKKEVITAEIIYYWMIAQNIPMECQKWHLNRLLTLVRVCSIKNQPPPKKGDKAQRRTALQNRSILNAERKAKLNTKG